MKQLAHAVSAVALALISSGTALAQSDAASYPNRRVRIVIPFAPGGATDYIARLVAQQLTIRWGQPFVVENRTGAGGVIGISDALRSAPDGYTLLVASASYAVNPAMIKLPFDPVKDARPVVNVALGTMAFIVNPSIPVKSLSDLVAQARANPGKLTYSSAGVGNTTDIGMRVFMSATHTQMIHSPYKGMAPALEAVAGDYAQVILSDIGAAAGLVAANRIRMIAVGGNKRLAQFPQIPTVSEAGYPLIMAGSWQGMFAPAATPPAIVNKLNAEINTVLRSKDVVASLAMHYAEPIGGTPDQFAQTVQTDITRFKTIAEEAGIKPE